MADATVAPAKEVAPEVAPVPTAGPAARASAASGGPDHSATALAPDPASVPDVEEEQRRRLVVVEYAFGTVTAVTNVMIQRGDNNDSSDDGGDSLAWREEQIRGGSGGDGGGGRVGNGGTACSTAQIAELRAELERFAQDLQPADADAAGGGGNARPNRPNSYPGYCARWRGTGTAPVFRGFSAPVLLWSSVGSFLGVLLLCAVHYGVFPTYASDFAGVVGSFGAQAVLLYAAPGVPLAQPWNAFVGNTVGSVVGVSCFKLLGQSTNSTDTLLGTDGVDWIAAPVAVSLAILAMHLTRSLHPPAGAMALIAVVGSDGIKASGYWYVLTPGMLASALQLAVALVVNNISCRRERWYPQYWTPARCPPPADAGGGAGGANTETVALAAVSPVRR